MTGGDRWLTVADAAARVGVSARTVRRYIARDGVTELLGRVRESEVVAAEKAARGRVKVGRPKKSCVENQNPVIPDQDS